MVTAQLARGFPPVSVTYLPGRSGRSWAIMDQAFTKSDYLVLRVTDMAIELHYVSVRRANKKTDFRASHSQKDLLYAMH